MPLSNVACGRNHYLMLHSATTIAAGASAPLMLPGEGWSIDDEVLEVDISNASSGRRKEMYPIKYDDTLIKIEGPWNASAILHTVLGGTTSWLEDPALANVVFWLFVGDLPSVAIPAVTPPIAPGYFYHGVARFTSYGKKQNSRDVARHSMTLRVLSKLYPPLAALPSPAYTPSVYTVQ